MGPKPVPVETRLLAKRRITAAGCWEFAGGTSTAGYGVIGVGSMSNPDDPRRTVATHRVAYELWVGPIPEALVIDHLCRNRLCFNPEHLRVCTHRENLLAPGAEGISAQYAERDACPKCGGPWQERHFPSGRTRRCLPCQASARRVWDATRKQKLAGLHLDTPQETP